MKKFLLFIALVLSVGIYAAAEMNTNTERIATNNMEEEVESAGKSVRCLVVFKVEDKAPDYFTWDLWKSTKSSNLYLGSYLHHYIVRRNQLKTYRGVNVSSYKYYAENYWERYYFNL
jgi:hypothetical protein